MSSSGSAYLRKPLCNLGQRHPDTGLAHSDLRRTILLSLLGPQGGHGTEKVRFQNVGSFTFRIEEHK